MVHTYRMSRHEGQRDWDNDVERKDRLRLLLTAAVALVVGYSGPLTIERTGLDDAEVSWWPLQSSSTPIDLFEIHENVPGFPDGDPLPRSLKAMGAVLVE